MACWWTLPSLSPPRHSGTYIFGDRPPTCSRDPQQDTAAHAGEVAKIQCGLVIARLNDLEARGI
jgi:hypothetical protein